MQEDQKQLNATMNNTEIFFSSQISQSYKIRNSDKQVVQNQVSEANNQQIEYICLSWNNEILQSLVKIKKDVQGSVDLDSLIDSLKWLIKCRNQTKRNTSHHEPIVIDINILWSDQVAHSFPLLCSDKQFKTITITSNLITRYPIDQIQDGEKMLQEIRRNVNENKLQKIPSLLQESKVSKISIIEKPNNASTGVLGVYPMIFWNPHVQQFRISSQQDTITFKNFSKFTSFYEQYTKVNSRILFQAFAAQKQDQQISNTLQSNLSYKIQTPHLEILDKNNFNDSQKYLIQGAYEYYHYNQDGINDQGWGCAYRSLQTIISWFRLQNFTSNRTPTISQIQSILVKSNSKPQKFINSAQWIGSLQVMIVLQQYLTIQSKILNISHGAQIIKELPTLKDHFKRQSTPIMIGGGVLAYTLLGIDIPQNHEDTRFLILDPHYSGKDINLKDICSKGWCSWKKLKNIFRKDTFYNLCMPQLPS